MLKTTNLPRLEFLVAINTTMKKHLTTHEGLAFHPLEVLGIFKDLEERSNDATGKTVELVEHLAPAEVRFVKPRMVSAVSKPLWMDPWHSAKKR